MLSRLIFLLSLSFAYIQAYSEGYGCENTICEPKAGNLLIGREGQLWSSSTCGLNEVETYCVVTPQGENVCRACASSQPYNQVTNTESHTIENVVPRNPRNKGRWWQSENGLNNVTIQLNLETQFQMLSTFLRFKTYRPAAMFIERSDDFGRTWKKYQYFSNNCERDFPAIPLGPRRTLEDVICTEKYSLLTPSEEGLVHYIVAPSPYNEEYDLYSKYIQNFTAITTLRINFVRLHTLGDVSIDRSPTLKRKYYYAVYEWFVYGRCSCFGHASECIPKNFREQKKRYKVYGVCRCKHNTTGDNCESCLPFYSNKPWQAATSTSPNSCEICNCNDHSRECSFNSLLYAASGNKNGGSCQNCEHNTEGENCQFCKPMYYRNERVPINHPDTCLKCECLTDGVRTNDSFCDQYTDEEKNTIAGHCKCKDYVTGLRCDECKAGYYNLDRENPKGCTPCKCHMLGTIENKGCDPHSGQCQCKRYTTGEICDKCIKGYFNLTESAGGCQPCACDRTGSLNSQCDPGTGDCQCKQFFTGRDCSQLELGYFINPPEGNLDGSQGGIIIDAPDSNGEYVVVMTIDPKDFENYDRTRLIITPEQTSQNCTPASQSFDIDRNTDKLIIPKVCFESSNPITINVEQNGGSEKEISVTDIYLLPITEDIKNVDPKYCEQFREIMDKKERGIATEYELRSIPQECEIYLNKESISWKDKASTAMGCECNLTGSTDVTCNKFSGQCNCKPGVTGRKCDECLPKHVAFGATGCIACNCSREGSVDEMCEETGKCPCKEGIIGEKCDKCPPGMWNFPNCQKCECNGLSDTCDQVTGECNDCRDNSSGYYCNKCAEGFYGDPLSEVKCQPCSCPGGGVNHAIGCKYDPFNKGMICQCKEGYTGENCSLCANNYYGNPSEIGGECKKCECNNNENPLNACDQITGDCIDCMNHSKGQHCELCADGYFGDATKQQCRQCNCYYLGSEDSQTCNPDTGACQCLPFVTGDGCFDCKDNYFNMTYGIGCQSCQCDPYGSFDMACDASGQCKCKPDRTGLKCDQCPYNKWGNPNTQEGCKDCQCDPMGSLSQTCDPKTGQCTCRDGIVGQNCDQCDRGTEGQLPNCKPCGQCWNDWDEKISALVAQIDEIVKSGKSPMPVDIKYDLMNLMNRLKVLENIKQNEMEEGTYEKLQEQFDRLKTKLNTIEESTINANEDTSTQLLATKDDLHFKYNKFFKDLDDLKDYYNETTRRLDEYNLYNPRIAYQNARELVSGINKETIDKRELDIKNATFETYFSTVKTEFEEQQTRYTTVANDHTKVKNLIYEYNKKFCGYTFQKDLSEIASDNNLCPSLCGGVGCPDIDRAVEVLQTQQVLSHIEYNPFTFSARSTYNVGNNGKNLYRPNGSPLGIGHFPICSQLSLCEASLEDKIRKTMLNVKNLEDSVTDSLTQFGDAEEILGKLKTTQDAIRDDLEKIDEKADTMAKRLTQKNTDLTEKINSSMAEIDSLKYFNKANFTDMTNNVLNTNIENLLDDVYSSANTIKRAYQENRGEMERVIKDNAYDKNKVETLLKETQEMEQTSTAYAKQFELTEDAKSIYNTVLNERQTNFLDDAEYVDAQVKLNTTAEEVKKESETFRETTRDLYDKLRTKYEESDQMYSKALKAQTNVKLNQDKIKTAMRDLSALAVELNNIEMKLNENQAIKPEGESPNESDALTRDALNYVQDISKYREELASLQKRQEKSLNDEQDLLNKLKTSRTNIKNILKSISKMTKFPKYNTP